jgi:hypothetical protein
MTGQHACALIGAGLWLMLVGLLVHGIINARGDS